MPPPLASTFVYSNNAFDSIVLFYSNHCKKEFSNQFIGKFFGAEKFQLYYSYQVHEKASNVFYIP
jgi:hypothetical protein